MVRLFSECFNLCRPRRPICIGLVVLFITSVNTTINNANQEPIDTNRATSQYWKIPGFQEPFYINFEKQTIQENSCSTPILNSMACFTGQKIKYPRTLEEKLALFRYQFQPQEPAIPTSINVGKTNMLEDSYEIFRHPESIEKLKALEKIIVTDEATGVPDEYTYTFKEWVLELTGTMLHPESGLFNFTRDYLPLLINIDSQLFNYYEFFGKVFGAAVYQNLFVSASFSNRFYKMMLGKEIEHEDIQQLDHIINFDHEIKSIRIAKEKRAIIERDYVKPVQAIMSAISNGFDQVVPVRFLKIFDVTELKLVLVGDSDIKGENLFTWADRMSEWKENTTVVDPGNTDRVIESFWRTISQFTNYQIRHLLQFVTGMSRLPVGGFSKLTPKFTIQRDYTKDSVPPEASISFNTITLYNWDVNNEDEVENIILKAIENVHLDKIISNNELYGILPKGWQRWKQKKSLSEEKEPYIYLNTDAGIAQRKDPRLSTSVKLSDVKKQQELYPKSLEEKVRLFEYQLHRKRNETNPGRLIILTDDISDIIEKSYKYIMNVESTTRLYPPFYVNIHDKYRKYNEVWIQEWLSALFRKVFDPINNFFQYVNSGDHRLQINPQFQDLNYFKFVGRLFGLSIIYRVPIAAYFIKPFYRLMLGERTLLEDIKDFDHSYYDTLSNVEKDNYSFESKDGTSLQNEDQIIDKLIREKYLMPILPQMSAILSGIDDFDHPHLFKIFNIDELKEYLGGTPTIDVQDWRENTRYTDFTKHSETVRFFWEIVEKFEDDIKERLLRFATGLLRIRPPGFKDLSPLFGIKLSREEEKSGITFQTKFNQITLPKYSNRDDLERDLKAAVATPFPFDTR